MPAGRDSEKPVYRVCANGERFDLISTSGRCIMTCHDAASAEHYALLLNEAFTAGYKAARKELRQEGER